MLGWQVMALHSAEGLGRPIADPTRKGAMKWLDTVSRDKLNVLAEYMPGRGITAPMTAEAAFCRVMLGQRLSDDQIDAIGRTLLKDRPAGGDDAKRNYYFIYYGSLALMQLQGPAWDDWNDAMRRDLLASQEREGDLDGRVAGPGAVGGQGGAGCIPPRWRHCRCRCTTVTCRCLSGWRKCRAANDS